MADHPANSARRDLIDLARRWASDHDWPSVVDAILSRPDLIDAALGRTADADDGPIGLVQSE